MHDLVIRNARLVDGSGDPERIADVAITNGVIVEFGAPGSGSASRRQIVTSG